MSNEKNTDLEAENLALKQKLAAAEAAAGAGKKSVPAVVGVYTSAKNKKKYQFKPGYHMFRLPGIEQMVKDKEVLKGLVDPMQRVQSIKALKNVIVMEHLIKIQFFGIEEVTK